MAGDTARWLWTESANEADNQRREALGLMLARWREGTYARMRWSFRHQRDLEREPAMLSTLRDRNPTLKRARGWPYHRGEAQISQRGAVAGRASVSDAVSYFWVGGAAGVPLAASRVECENRCLTGPRSLRVLQTRRRGRSERFESERILGRRD